jgi:hypothetical protein
MVKRVFYIDTEGNLRKGHIFDAKGNGIGQTLYSYRGKQMIEEQMFDKNGDLIRRLFPPGALPGVAANAKHSLSYTFDPKDSKKPIKVESTDDLPVTPVEKELKEVTPGSLMGQPLKNQHAQSIPQATNPTKAPGGRRPVIPQKKENSGK